MPYFTGDKIKIFTPRSEKFNKYNAQFIITAAKKSFAQFSWGSSSFSVNILQDVEVILPTTSNGNVDYDFMALFIKAQQKLAIKDVVEWRKTYISTTQQLVAA